MGEEIKPGFCERMLTGFFGDWEPADKLAFVFITVAFVFAAIGKIDVSRVLDYAFGFLSGRGVGVSVYGAGWQSNSLGYTPINSAVQTPTEPRGEE